MRKAILHIGTEKTGSTSIQRYLFANRSRLIRKGFLFPQSCGFLNNRKLVAFARRDADPRLIADLGDVEASEHSQSDWNEHFVSHHCREVIPFQTRRRSVSTVVYSAEHLQSRLTSEAEVQRVRTLLEPLYDDIKVLVYLRRQDRYALSRHSTILRAGGDSEFTFEGVNRDGPYYDHLGLLRLWSDVFGEASVTARIFERNKLVKQDVVADFCAATGVPHSRSGMVATSNENKALSATAQNLMRCFNRMPDDDPGLSGMDRGKLRDYLNEQLEQIADEHGKCLPSRASAQSFMAYFAEGNEAVSQRWLAGERFDASFDEYPIDVSTLPVIANAEERLSALIADFNPKPFSRPKKRDSLISSLVSKSRIAHQVTDLFRQR